MEKLKIVALRVGMLFGYVSIAVGIFMTICILSATFTV